MSKRSDQAEKSRVSKLKRIVFWVGTVCCLQLLVVGAVGVMRGSSVQSWTPAVIFLVGAFLLIPFHRRHKGVSFLSSLCLIVLAVVGASQGRHQKRGEELYEEGKYEEAITELRQEIDTWYLRLTYNHEEAPSLLKIAQCQSQMGRFGEARETYRRIEETFRGYHKDRAQAEGATMEAKLAEIEDLEKDLAAAEDNMARAMVHFDLALAYRQLTCHAKVIEHYEAVQKLDAPERLKESAKKFADKLR